MLPLISSLPQSPLTNTTQDNSDHQYGSFRRNVPYLAIVFALHSALRRIGWKVYTNSDRHRSYPDPDDARLAFRTRFDIAFGLLFIAVLHGASAFKIVAILYLNFQIGRNVPPRFAAAATWISAIAILFANDIYDGFPYGRLLGFGWAHSLDRFSGLMSRWELLFKFSILRMISFNIDYSWSLSTTQDPPTSPSDLSDRDRVRLPARPHDYSFLNYLAYTLYSPLYLAGPIMTFNDYIAQNRSKPPSISRSRTVLYGIRFVIAFLAMELFLHYIYVIAIFRAKPDWSTYSPFQLSMLGFFNLTHIWLKLLLPWRFFRLWALADGIDAPENMVRCVSNNYSALAFWRGWHRSYNRWVVRYIYVPLGGSRISSDPILNRAWAALNFFVVFTFVALWHDIKLRLLQWGWLISLFVLPEVLARMAFPPSKWRHDQGRYRVLAGIGAVANILMMMIANLVGFAIGLDGIKDLIAGIAGSAAGLAFVLAACAAIFVAVQVMFELREEELRNGIVLAC